MGRIKGFSGARVVATVQLKVLWQEPQSSVVLTCWTCLAVAVMPLWQLWQVALMPKWLKLADCHERVPWQVLQS